MPASLYGLAVKWRNRLYDKGRLKSHRFALPVISVGNITVGGTGKTPHIEYLVRLLQQECHVAVLSRGYRRRSHGFVLAAPHTPMQEIGDEPWQIKHKFPHIMVAVDADRCHGIECLMKQEIQEKGEKERVVLLDDAYQHRRVVPGLNIVLVNYRRPVWQDALLPAGRLREPVEELRRAHVIIVTKCPADIKPTVFTEFTEKLSPAPHQQIFFSTLGYSSLQPLFVPALPHRPLSSIAPVETVFLFTAIASPAAIADEIKRYTPHIVQFTYPDHHYFTRSDIEELHTAVEACKGKKIIITTEKDGARLLSEDTAAMVDESLRYIFYTLPLEIKILRNQQQKFNRLVLDYVHGKTPDDAHA